MAASRDISLEFEDWPPVPELQIKELPSPCEVFLRGVTNEINAEDVGQMVESQTHMLSRFEKTNEMLLNFNVLSAARYEATQRDFQQHTQLLTAMKRDLDSVFMRIRALKEKLSKQHPDAFKASVCDITAVLNEEEEESLSENPGGLQTETPATEQVVSGSETGSSEPVPSSLTEDAPVKKIHKTTEKNEQDKGNI